MANKFKRSIAMLLVLNMLTGMIPAQALAEEEDSGLTVTVVVHSETSSKEASSSSDSGSSDNGSDNSGSDNGSDNSGSDNGSENSGSDNSGSDNGSDNSGSDEGADNGADEGADNGSDESADNGADEGADNGSDEGADNGSDEGADNGSDEGADNGADEGADNGSDESADNGADEGADEGTDEGEGEPVPASETAEGGEAAEGEEESERILESELTTEGGDITVTEESETTETTDDDGNTVTTTVTETTTEGTLKGGETIEGEETYTEKITTNSDGVEIGSAALIEGSEIITDNDPAEKNEIDVTVQLIPGEKVTITEIVESLLVEGKKPEELGKGEYEFTETTLTTEKTVEVESQEGEAKVEVTGTSELKPLIPDRTIDDDGDLKDEQLLKDYTYSDGFEDYDPTEAPDGYDYRLTGFGQMSMYGNALEGGGRTGALQFELQYDPDFVPDAEDNKEITDLDIYTAYCADINTDGKDNWWYRIDSLDDAGYYSEEAAEHIRAIALGGYWGTSNEADENGNYQTGSLEKLKADMKTALSEGKLEGVTEEMIDSLTAGQAVNATQSAIWMYANATTEGSVVDTERLIDKGFHKNKNERVNPSEEDVNNVRAIFNYLLSLDPIEKGEHEEIIDQESFIVEDSMSITVGEKTEGHENNSDDNDDNDVYNVDLNFALVVTPSEDGDDLIVQVVSVGANGEAVIAAQGRIAGGDAEQDKANGFNDVHYDAETGTYTLTDLELAEGTPFDFELQLVGTQYLEQGVYIFNSEIRNDVSSQTLVTVVEGEKEVNVSKGYQICFNVEEKSTSITERHWRKDNDPTNDPRNTPPTVEYRLTQGVGQLEIIDEEVPLAEPPQTGDISMLWFAMIMMSGLGLCMLNLLEKKREEA